jgi:hypothetical protein
MLQTHGRIDEAISQKLNLTDESSFIGSLKMTDVGRNMYCAYTNDAEEILTFKIVNVLKSQLLVRRIITSRNNYLTNWLAL